MHIVFFDEFTHLSNAFSLYFFRVVNIFEEVLAEGCFQKTIEISSIELVEHQLDPGALYIIACRC